MAGRPKKTENDRKAALVRLEEDIVLEMGVYAKLKGKSLSDVMGEQLMKWWTENPEREEIRKFVQKQTEEKEAPKKKTTKAA